MSDSVAQKVGVSFARRYYTTAVEHPSQLVSFYAPSAATRHGKHAAVKGAGAELTRLFESTSFGRLAVRKVDLKVITTAQTASGNVAVHVEGVLEGARGAAAAQPFTQDVELQEVSSKVYVIVADTLALADSAAKAAPSAIPWATETPPMFSQKPAEGAAEGLTELQQPASTAAVKAPAAEVEETKAEEKKVEKKAEEKKEEEAPVKAPQSFAEALKMKRAAGAGPAPAPVRVTGKDAAAAAAAASPKERKGNKAAAAAKDEKSKPAAAAAPGAKKAAAAPAKRRPSGAAAPVVYYDVIVKGLPTGTTEAAVRAMLPADVVVSLVKVESKAARNDPKDVRTFAFVQVDAAALKAASLEKKDVVARIVAEGTASGEAQKITFEEVHEKKRKFAAKAPAAPKA